MNKLAKIGPTALCGSLVAVASQAGELSVTGGSTATWSSNSGTKNGNPIGMASAISFSGSGELENGTTFTMTLAHGDQASTYSGGEIVLTTPSFGTIAIDQSGGGIDRFDDMMPTAWEEVDGTSLGTGLVTVSGVKGSSHIEWGVPSTMLPDGMSAHVAWSPRASGGYVNDKSTGSTGTDGVGGGYDIAISHGGIADGANVFVGYSAIDWQNDLYKSKKKAWVAGATFAVGPATVGYQVSREMHNPISTALVSEYDNSAYGISFAVNDDLSISYAKHQSNKVTHSATADVELDNTSLQAAYTMGGATISAAMTDADNAKYSSGTDTEATTVALSLAF